MTGRLPVAEIDSWWLVCGCPDHLEGLTGFGSTAGGGVSSSGSPHVVPSNVLRLGTVGNRHIDADGPRLLAHLLTLGALDLESTVRAVDESRMMSTA